MFNCCNLPSCACLRLNLRIDVAPTPSVQDQVDDARSLYRNETSIATQVNVISWYLLAEKR